MLTSRNALGPLRGLLARQNPDLMASGEGGSNLTLVRTSSPRPRPGFAADPGARGRARRGRAGSGGSPSGAS